MPPKCCLPTMPSPTGFNRRLMSCSSCGAAGTSTELATEKMSAWKRQCGATAEQDSGRKQISDEARTVRLQHSHHDNQTRKCMQSGCPEALVLPQLPYCCIACLPSSPLTVVLVPSPCLACFRRQQLGWVAPHTAGTRHTREVHSSTKPYTEFHDKSDIVCFPSNALSFALAQCLIIDCCSNLPMLSPNVCNAWLLRCACCKAVAAASAMLAPYSQDNVATAYAGHSKA